MPSGTVRPSSGRISTRAHPAVIITARPARPQSLIGYFFENAYCASKMSFIAG